MRTVGLFSGIGGLEAGLARSGFETSLLCEIEPNARVVLEDRFPGTALSQDVRHVAREATRLTRNVELIAAGFPCQDLSQVGRTNGINGSNSGLVRYVFEILEKRRTPWVLLENVPFLLSLRRGEAIRALTSSFERLGYKWAYRVLDTQAFGLPQRRRRMYLLASRRVHPARVLFPDLVEPPHNSRCRSSNPAYGFYWTEGTRGLGWAVDAVPPLKAGSGVGIPSSPAVWLPGNGFVTPAIEAAERLQGFAAGWTQPGCAVKGNRFRWTLVGNAVSVPVAEWLGQRIHACPGRLPPKKRAVDASRGWPAAAFGGGRDGAFHVEVDDAPLDSAAPALSDFLGNETAPLSQRAAAGFLRRLQSSRLRRDETFETELAEYVEAS